MSPAQLVELRRTEAQLAASVIGAECVCLDVDDGAVRYSTDARSKVIELIRRSRPHVVLTHWPDDYHADHAATAELVTACSWFAASPGHETESPALDSPVPVFYMDTLAGLSFEPCEYVDIGEVWEVKQSMLRCHASQSGVSAQHGAGDLVALARDLARFRGQQCAVEYAEGFRPCLKWKRIRPYRLLP